MTEESKFPIEVPVERVRRKLRMQQEVASGEHGRHKVQVTVTVPTSHLLFRITDKEANKTATYQVAITDLTEAIFEHHLKEELDGQAQS